jgi:hypothetical protein
MKIRHVAVVATLAMAMAPLACAGTPCSARASQIWTASSQKLTVESLADGPSCAQAVVVIVVRNSKGNALWVESSKASDIMIFSQGQAANTRSMAAVLKQWVTSDTRLQQTSALPEWKKGADQPVAGEFPFYTSEGVSQDDYTQMRQAKLPMFCYVAGMESEACLVLAKDGTIVKIGSQSFPG